MQIVNSRNKIIKSGNGILDYDFIMEQEIIDNKNEKLFISIHTFNFGESLYSVSYKSYIDSKEEEYSPIEFYSQIEDSISSSYYDIFKLLGEESNKLIKDTLTELDDTKYQGGIRYGAKVDKNGLSKYVEAVCYISKEDKYLYEQIILNDNHITYSLTKESIFLKLDMGDLYNAYYNKPNKIEYLFKTDNLDSLNEYEYLKEDYKDLLNKIENQKY